MAFKFKDLGPKDLIKFYTPGGPIFDMATGGAVTRGIDNMVSGNIRKKHPGEVLSLQEEILKRYNDSIDESGVRSGMSKFSALSDMFGQQANQNYLDTTEGKSFTRQIEDTTNKRANRLRGDASTMGLTSEAYLSGIGKINEQEGASMNQLVSGSDARRRALRSQQMQALSQVLGGEQMLLGAKSGRFMQSLGAAQGIYGEGVGLQNQSNQAAMDLFGGLLNAGSAAAGAA